VNELRDRVVREIRKVVVGQDHVVEVLLAATSVGGHLLLEGVPGVAKTLVANAYARALGIEFRRVQFTPDMLPSDLTGTMTLRAGELAFRPGPVFTNLFLADEINRTPPKTQAALLEAMQERQVSVDGVARPLPDPFVVVATQNPIEYEGTYPLPEAQLDRFMFHIVIEHPPEDEEFDVVRTTTAVLDPQFQRPVSAADLISFQRLVRRVPVAEPVMRYALRLVRTSRPKAPGAPEMVEKYVAFGASVRAAQYLILGAKAKALTEGRYHVSFDDIRSLAHPVLRHRVLVNFRAESEGVTSDSLIDELIKTVPLPKSGM
jgi:MoxR-like ATPase